MRPPPDTRACALDIFHDVLYRGRAFDDAFAGHEALGKMESRDRAFVRLLVATALRRLGQIDAVLAACLDKEVPARHAIVRDILRLGCAQLLFLKTAAHAAVDTAVRLTGERGRGGYTGLVNAVLRRVSRGGEQMIGGQDAARVNTPGWLWDSWVSAYGEETARAIAEANLEEAPLDITVKTDAAKWAQTLGASVLATGTVRRAAHTHAGPITELPGFSEGAWWVQDAAAAIPATLLGNVAGKTVIDLCAAPGGKTAQLAARGAKVVALDTSRSRMDRIAENLKRLGLAAELLREDALSWRPREKAPFVLLDAPCTATGAMRRHPDIAYLKTAADVKRLTGIQDRLLDAAAQMVVAGGMLVYSTCSLQKEEGPERIAAFLARANEFSREPIAAAEVGGQAEMVTAEGDLRTFPFHLRDRGGIDGFYAARLRRRA